MTEEEVRSLLHEMLENIIARIGQYPMRGHGWIDPRDLVSALLDAQKDILGEERT